MTLQFDPNNSKAPQAPVYATYIPIRSPQFKTYNKKNHATSSLSQKAGGYGSVGHAGILYEHIGGVWVEIDRYEPPTHCAHCNHEFDLRWHSWQKPNLRRPVRLDKYDIKPVYKKPMVCSTCYEEHFSYSAENPIDPNEVGVKNGL